MGAGRLEPLPRNSDIEEGLDARVFDPLWLLGRQWQLGEFQGDDAGTPYVCDITGDAHLVTGWRPAADIEPGPWQPFDPVTTALETLVEAEPAARGGIDRAAGRRRPPAVGRARGRRSSRWRRGARRRLPLERPRRHPRARSGRTRAPASPGRPGDRHAGPVARDRRRSFGRDSWHSASPPRMRPR